MPITESERAAVVAELERSRDDFLAAMAAVPADAWGRAPAPGRWSAAECAEHVIRVERGMRKFLPTVLAATPPDPARRGTLADRDAALTASLRGRATRRLAPEQTRPEGRYLAAAAQAGVDFADARAGVLDFARATDADLRAIFVPHPALRELDGVQWLLFVAHHTDRHAAQLAELRAALGA